MRLPHIIAILVFASILLSVNVNITQAAWPSLSSGYAATSNWHGEDVPPGADVVIIAGTTDADVLAVNFIWKDPDGTVIRNETWPIMATETTPTVPGGIPGGVPDEISDWATANQGVEVHYCWDEWTLPAESTNGDWGVQTHFLGSDGNENGNNGDVIKTKATSFLLVPELPLGVLAVVITSLVILGIIASRRTTLKPTLP